MAPFKKKRCFRLLYILHTGRIHDQKRTTTSLSVQILSWTKQQNLSGFSFALWSFEISSNIFFPFSSFRCFPDQRLLWNPVSGILVYRNKNVIGKCGKKEKELQGQTGYERSGIEKGEKKKFQHRNVRKKSYNTTLWVSVISVRFGL